RAAAERHGARVADRVAVDAAGRRGYPGKIDARDAQAGQAVELAGIGDAVAVGVEPDLQCAPRAVTGVNLEIVVRIQRHQLGKAILARGAEHLSDAVDGAVCVEVPYEKTGVAAGPGGLLGEPAVGHVKESRGRRGI